VALEFKEIEKHFSKRWTTETIKTL